MPRPTIVPLARLAAPALLAWAAPAAAQPVTKDAATRPPTCPAAIRRYESWPEVPTPFDSLRLPPSEPVRVTSPEEAQAAEQKLLERAAGVGATGIVILEERTERDGDVRMRRRVVPVFVRADSARAYRACGK